MRSTDGGTTWTRLDSAPSPPSYPFCLMTNSHTFQGKVEWGRDGALYYALDGWDTQDAPRRSVFVARSDDFGDSWAPVAVADARGTEGAAPATTTTTTPVVSEVGPASGSPAGAQQTATTTTTVPPDSRVANKTDVNNFGGSNPVVAIDDEGTAYVAWVTRYANLTPSPSAAHFLSTSTDRGKTWTTTQITPFVRENINNFGGYMLQWSPDAGARGSLHLVYEGSKRAEIGPFASNFDLNGPPAVASTDAYALIGWDDTRFGDKVTETQDIFASAVQFEEVGGTNRATAYILSGVVGLVVVGLILFAFSLLSRRVRP